MHSRPARFGSWVLLAVATGVCNAQTSPVQLSELTTGLSRPLLVRAANDGSNRLFIAEQGGTIRIFRNGQLLATPFLQLAGAGGTAPPFGFTAPDPSEQGLLGLAFHPLFATNRQLFVHYSDTNGDTVIARYLVSAANPDIADTGTAAVILRVDQDFSNHNGGSIEFGPNDGFLYIGLGDGGSGGDPCGRAQTLNPASLVNTGGSCPSDSSFTNTGGNANSRALLGKVLRIDVDNTTGAGGNGLCAANANGSAAYAIPGGNPFAGSDTASGCDEIWFHGLRNPFRFSFDRSNGDIFIGDVGQNRVEEIDFFAGGAPLIAGVGVNFEWDECEGNENFNEANFNSPIPGGCPIADSALTPRPILSYDHGLGCSVTGGVRYRGAIAAFQGTYTYGDYCSGRIWFGTETGGNWSSSVWQDTAFNITGFGEDEAGELYVTDYSGGRVLKFVTTALFANGFE